MKLDLVMVAELIVGIVQLDWCHIDDVERGPRHQLLRQARGEISVNAGDL